MLSKKYINISYVVLFIKLINWNYDVTAKLTRQTFFTSLFDPMVDIQLDLVSNFSKKYGVIKKKSALWGEDWQLRLI